MMNRRTFLCGLTLGALAVPLAEAQQAGKVYRVGILWQGASPPRPPRMEAFGQGLRESGYVEGQNVLIELRYAEGADRLHELAGELVRANVSVITTFGDLAPQMAKRATTAVPIVALTDDFVGAKLVANLARPDGNITGVTILSPELSAKTIGVAQGDSPESVPGGSYLGSGHPIPAQGDGRRGPITGSATSGS